MIKATSSDSYYHVHHKRRSRNHHGNKSNSSWNSQQQHQSVTQQKQTSQPQSVAAATPKSKQNVQPPANNSNKKSGTSHLSAAASGTDRKGLTTSSCHQVGGPRQLQPLSAAFAAAGKQQRPELNRSEILSIAMRSSSVFASLEENRPPRNESMTTFPYMQVSTHNHVHWTRVISIN